MPVLFHNFKTNIIFISRFKMNPITNIKNQNKLNERELQLGMSGDLGKSWHQTYADSAWVYIGGLPYDLTEGDVISVFSQYGEVMNINLIRDQKTGKSKGFCFLCYQDQRSTVLAVDNLNGMSLLRRMIRVDHVEEYKVPKYREDADEETKRLWELGCAPKPIRMPTPEPDEIEKRKAKKKAADEALIPIKEMDSELKKTIKRLKKEKKKAKKDAKKEKKRLKKLKKLAELDPEGDWKNMENLMDKGATSEKDLYGQNEHFNFGKEFEEKAEPTHNPRPDFAKADWRDIEIWKVIREQEKAEKGANPAFEEGPAYVSSRYKRV